MCVYVLRNEEKYKDHMSHQCGGRPLHRQQFTSTTHVLPAWSKIHGPHTHLQHAMVNTHHTCTTHANNYNDVYSHKNKFIYSELREEHKCNTFCILSQTYCPRILIYLFLVCLIIQLSFIMSLVGLRAHLVFTHFTSGRATA